MGSAINYDLCINSARYGIEESVELIKRIIYKEKNKHNIYEDALKTILNIIKGHLLFMSKKYIFIKIAVYF